MGDWTVLALVVGVALLYLGSRARPVSQFAAAPSPAAWSAAAAASAPA